jgi:hypothetical protein
MEVAVQSDSQCIELNTQAPTQYCANEEMLLHTLIITIVLSSACSMQKGFVAEHCVCSAACEIGQNEGSCAAPMHVVWLRCHRNRNWK